MNKEKAMENKCSNSKCIHFYPNRSFGCINENIALECRMEHPVYQTEWYQVRNSTGKYVYKCFNCYSDLTLNDNYRCPACGRFICPACNKCFCHATDEQKAAWEERKKRY